MMWISINRYELWIQEKVKGITRLFRKVRQNLEVHLRIEIHKYLIQVIKNHFSNKKEATKNVKTLFRAIKINNPEFQCMCNLGDRHKVIILIIEKIFGGYFAMVVRNNQNQQN